MAKVNCCALAMLNVAPETIVFSLCSPHVDDGKAEVAPKQVSVNWRIQFKVGGIARILSAATNRWLGLTGLVARAYTRWM